MTAYNAIISSETDPDEPLTSFLAKRWSDNWIAGFEGQAAAPKLLQRAIKPVAWGTTLKYDYNPAAPILTAGQSAKLSRSVGVQNFGNVDFYVETEVTSGSGAFTLNRIRAGVTVALLSTGTLGTHGNTARNVNVAIQAGDLLQVVVVGGSTSGNSARVNSIALRTSGDDLWVTNDMMGYSNNAYILP